MIFNLNLIASHFNPVSGRGPVEIQEEFAGTAPVLSVFADFGRLFTELTTFLFLAAFVFSFAYLIWGGFRLITAGGDDRAVSEARETITYAIVGIAIVFLAYLIVKLVEGVTGVIIF